MHWEKSVIEFYEKHKKGPVLENAII